MDKGVVALLEAAITFEERHLELHPEAVIAYHLVRIEKEKSPQSFCCLEPL